MITHRKIKKHIYFNSQVPNSTVINNEFHKSIVQLMEAAHKLKDKEVLVLMRNSDYYRCMTTSYLTNRVFFTTDMEDELLKNNDITYSAFHNHPDNSNFSYSDLVMFIDYDKLLTICVCTNNCKHISLLIKTRELDTTTKKEAKSELSKIKIDFSNSKTLGILEKYGISYLHRNN